MSFIFIVYLVSAYFADSCFLLSAFKEEDEGLSKSLAWWLKLAWLECALAPFGLRADI
jgi:hypothetical protein